MVSSFLPSPDPLDYSKRLSRRLDPFDAGNEPDETTVTCTGFFYIVVDGETCNANYTFSSSSADWSEDDEDEEEVPQEPAFERWQSSSYQRRWCCPELSRNHSRRLPFRTQHCYRPSQPHG